ncbi:unnamed protein product, partial [Mesorhabditis belari]|uniref:Protein farnesyltransferase/geranylgeranyltransferase type-1 subunit alpha n=1 Tax=Mesorhabditis belari TaxID=2138241 RepID=A0AAF3EFG4_9BILA
MSEGTEVKSSPFYRDRDDWADITPILPTPEENTIVRIDAGEAFVDAFSYLRAVLQKKEISERCFQLTNDCIQLNAANYTVWQYRRDLLKALGHDLKAELRFIGDIIMENPKNYQVWHHRRTLVEWIGNPGDELDFTAAVFDDEPKNYHGWQHRQWVVRHFHLVGQREIDYTTKLLLEDSYNNSAWNYRYFILQLWEKIDHKETLDIEINFCKQIAGKLTHNESVWNYLAGLLISGGLISRPDVIEWAEKLYSETENRAHYLVSFLLDIEMEKIEEGLDGGLIHVTRAKQFCKELEEIDPVRTNFWRYQQALAENKHEKQILHAQQHP